MRSMSKTGMRITDNINPGIRRDFLYKFVDLMKNIALILILFVGFSSVSYSQSIQPAANPTPELSTITIQPKFPGGKDAFQKYIAYKIQPFVDRPIDIKVSFIVETDGTLSNVKFLTYLREPLRGKLTEAILSSPTWLTGTVDGKPARATFILPINIRI